MERWALIKPHVPNKGMVLDIGSNLGYFGVQIINSFPDVAVVSIESDPRIIARQKKVLASYKTTRICAIQGFINSSVTDAWVQTCDWFDLTLLLSIIHWFDDPAKVVHDLSRMSSRIIAEVPDARDTGACGQDKIHLWGDNPLAWFQKVTNRPCRHIGHISRHTSHIPAHLILIEGPVDRTPTIPYWDYQSEHPRGNDYRLAFDGESLRLAIRQEVVDYVPGINLVSLMKLGRLVWPRPRYFIRQGVAAIQSSYQHEDPLPHNMLWTLQGIKIIDKDDLQWGHPPAVARAILKKQIMGWKHNKLANKHAYVPRLPWWRLLTWYWPKAIARRILPEPVFKALKAKLNA